MSLDVSGLGIMLGGRTATCRAGGGGDAVMGGGCSTRPRQRHGALRSSEGRTSGALRAAPPRARQRLDGGVRRMAARMEAGHREEAPSDAGSNSIQELQDRALVGVRR
eukprot:7112517-Pyramimonas_sp.AAC.1